MTKAASPDMESALVSEWSHLLDASRSHIIRTCVAREWSHGLHVSRSHIIRTCSRLGHPAVQDRGIPAHRNGIGSTAVAGGRPPGSAKEAHP